MPDQPRILYFNLGQDERKISDVLRRWTAVVDGQTASSSSRTLFVKLDLARPLKVEDGKAHVLNEVDLVLEHLDNLPVVIKEAALRWDESSWRIVAVSPHIERLHLVLGPAHPDELGLDLPSLQHLHLRGGPYKMPTLDLPHLSTLLLENVTFEDKNQWLEVLHAFPSLRVLGVGPFSLKAHPGSFTSAHLPASLKHLYVEDWYLMWLDGYACLHDLPASIRTLTVAEAGHYQAKTGKRAILARYCSSRRIKLVVLRTEVRGTRRTSLAQWAASL